MTTRRAASIGGIVLWVSAALGAALLLVALSTDRASATPKFERWLSEFEERCSQITRSREVWIETLQPRQLLITVYPERVSPLILDWVGKGGALMLTLDARSAPRAEALLKQLDLTVNFEESQDSGIKGAWPFPQSQLGDMQNMNPFISPWMMISPVTFHEGSSWFKGGIAPIAIDESGRSVAYRVRYGKGSFTLFGDADALSDRLLDVSLNRRFAKSLMRWLTKRDHAQGKLCSLRWISARGSVLSRREEGSLKSKLERFKRELISWWREATSPQDQFKRVLRLAYFILALFFVFLVNMLTSRQDWKRRFVQKRRRP